MTVNPPKGRAESDISRADAESSDRRAFLADGAALGASAMFTALIGLFGWLLAARLLPTEAVGHATAFVNGFILVAALAELGLGQASLRWLPEAGGERPVIVTRIYLTTLAVCLVLAIGWSFVAPVGLGGELSPGWSRVLFVASALAWMIFHVQDYVLTGLGAARWVPVENITFGLLRIVLLVALAHWFGGLGIVLSWGLGSLLCVVAVTTGLARARGRVVGRAGVLPARQRIVRDASAVYTSTIALTLLNNLVPVLVVVRYGPQLGAVFSVIWLGLNALDVAGLGFGNALVVRLRGRSLTNFRVAVSRVLPLFAVPLAVAYLAADPLLSLFGPAYARHGDELLQLVVLGALLRLVVVLVCSVHFGAGRVARMAVLQWLTAIVLVGSALLTPVADDLGRLGVYYLISQVALAVVAVTDLVVVGRRENQQSQSSARG